MCFKLIFVWNQPNCLCAKTHYRVKIKQKVCVKSHEKSRNSQNLFSNFLLFFLCVSTWEFCLCLHEKMVYYPKNWAVFPQILQNLSCNRAFFRVSCYPQTNCVIFCLIHTKNTYSEQQGKTNKRLQSFWNSHDGNL